MRIDGHWLLCKDGVLRPVIKIGVLSISNELMEFDFLVDTGADRTVLNSSTPSDSGLPASPVTDSFLSGLGGNLGMVEVETALVFTADGRSAVTFRSQYAAVTAFEALDMSILGRDILTRFSLIVDRSGDTICLLSQRHRYAITSN